MSVLEMSPLESRTPEIPIDQATILPAALWQSVFLLICDQPAPFAVLPRCCRRFQEAFRGSKLQARMFIFKYII